MIVASNSMTLPASQRGGRPTFYGADTTTDWSGKFDRQLAILQQELQEQPRYGDSLAFQTRWRTGIDPYYFEQKRDERSRLMTLRGAAWERIDWFIRYYQQHFSAIVDNENDNWNFYAGYQWSDAELAKIQEARLIPHAANYLARWARTLIGEERGAETIYNFSVDDPQMQSLADLYNDVVPKICRMNEWEHKSSQDFANLAIGGRCANSVRPDPYDPFRKLALRSERPQEFMYDFENMEDAAGNGLNEMGRFYYADLEDLVFRYPEWEDYLRTYDFSQFAGFENLLLFTVAQPKVAPTTYKRAYQKPQTFFQRPYYRHRRVAWVTEHYTMGGLRQFAVTDFNTNVDYDFDAADQAAYFYRNMRDYYQAKAMALTGQPTFDLVAPPEPILRKVVDQEIWCADTLLEVKTTKCSRFPYNFMHNEFHRGEWRGFFQDDKLNSQTRNRMQIYWDMLLGGLKGKNFYDLALFPSGTTIPQAEEMLRDPMKAVVAPWKKEMDMSKHHIRIDPPNYGTLPETIINYIDKSSAFSNGGLNSIGEAEFAGQSDKLRRGLQGSSMTGTVPLMKDYQWHETRTGESIQFASQFLHPTALLGYVNAENRQTVMPLLQEGKHTTEMSRLTCVTEEVLAGPRKRDQQKATMLEMVQRNEAAATDIMPEILSMEDLPQAMLARIEQRQSQRMQAESQQAQQEQQLAQFEAQKGIELKERKAAVDEAYVDIAKNPPVAFAISSKIGAPGPDAMAEIYQQHGIDADPAHVLASEAKQDLKDQARDNLRQQAANAIDIPHQRALKKIWPEKPASGGRNYKPKAGKSAKDATARSRKGQT